MQHNSNSHISILFHFRFKLISLLLLTGCLIPKQIFASEPAPLTKSDNPAALSLSQIDSTVKIAASYFNENGDFKAVQMGENLNQFNLTSEGYRTLNNTRVYGAFTYSKEFENNINYTNTYSSYRSTPYLFIDTIGGDIYKRESFYFNGKVSHTFKHKLNIGADAKYLSGLGAQNHDPRAQSKISNSQANIGVLYHISPSFKIGGNIFYHYYNEEVNIEVVQASTTYYIFALTGLGTYSKHEAASFNRLYARNTFGGSLQFKLKSHVFILGYSNFYENVHDGRKDGKALWSALKNDSKLQNQTITGNYIFTFQKDQYRHQISLHGAQSRSVGAEVLQSLNLVNEDYSIYQWQTLSEEDKYSLETQDVSLKYELSKFKSTVLKDYSLSMLGAYNTYIEKYYTPDMSIDYSSAKIEVEGYKHFSLNAINLSCMLSGALVKSIDKKYDLNYQTFITELLILPDYNYYTSDYWQARTKITIDFTLKQNTTLYLQLSGNSKNAIKNTYKRYISFGLTLGVLI